METLDRCTRSAQAEVMPVLPPPLVALAAGLAQRALADGTQSPGRGRAAVVAGVSLASVSMAGAAAGRFRRSGTTVEPFHPEEASVLVTAGANAISRNPMYVGMAGLLVAHAIWRGSWVALAPVAAFVAFIDRVQIRAEESALLEKFGSAYDAYRAATPRWLDLRSANAAHPGS
jgi:protein-S-isoprenylcysteine O-methyltransferase Ste14